MAVHLASDTCFAREREREEDCYFAVMVKRNGLFMHGNVGVVVAGYKSVKVTKL